MNVIQVIAKTANRLGESPVWDFRNQSLWWTDIQSNTLFNWSLADKKLSQWKTPQRLCSFGLHSQGGLIAAFESGFAWYHPQSDKLNWINSIIPKQALMRLNDGRCDRFGRFIAGGMVEADNHSNTTNKLASLYSLSPSGQVMTLRDGISIANSICWSPDNQTLYFADSAKQTIWSYDYDKQSGLICNQRIFATTQEQCFPDGSAVDSRGYLWNAQWGASQIVVYQPSGCIEQIIPLPVSQPTCVAFGGPHLKTLFITSAIEGLNTQQRSEQPLAGCLLSINVGVAGLNEGVFGRTTPIA